MPVHNTPPAPAAGIAIEEEGVEVAAAAAVLNFGVGFDVTEDPADQANVALDLTEDVWTFAEGGFRFRDDSGPLLYTGPSGDDLFLTGDLDVSGVAAIGSLASIDAGGRMALRVQHETGDISVFSHGAAIYAQAVVDTSTQGFAYGLTGEVKYTGSGVNSYITALSFWAIQAGANLLWLHGIQIGLIMYEGAGTVNQSYGLHIVPEFENLRPGNFRGIYVEGHTGMNAVYGIRVDDFTGTTIRLLQLGPGIPYLRLVGGAVPGANNTNLYLGEGSPNTLRRAQWKDGAAIGAGDKVMVLV